MAATSKSASDVTETGAGGRTVGSGAGGQSAGVGAAVDIGMDISQTEAHTSQLVKQTQLTFSNDKMMVDQQLSEQRQREFERQSINAESMAQQGRMNHLQNALITQQQRHADDAHQTRLEVISDANLGGMSEVLQLIGEAIAKLAGQIAEQDEA